MNLQRLLDRLFRPRPRPDSPVGAPRKATSLGITPQAPLPKLDRLDLQAAIIHHLEWCVLFNEHLSIDSAQAQHQTPLPDAQQSELGKWLAAMAQRPAGQHPHFVELQKEHERFHVLARQALEHARNQRMDLASTLLNTEFERSRAKVLDLLRQLQKN